MAMAFFFGFYLLNQVGIFMAKRLWVAPWIGAWMSNAVFLVTGIVLAIRMR